MFETTLRYNSLNNKHAVEGELPRFDSLLIDAKMLAHSRKALPQFVHDLSEERSIEYYIDPIISDFRSGKNFRFSDGTLRGWYDTYVERLGDPLQRLLSQHSNADPRQMGEGDIRGVARSVVQFQETFVAEQLDQHSGKYVEVAPETVRPKAVVPWHHRIHETEDLDPYRTILEASIDEASVNLKPCLHTTKTFIQETANRSDLVNLADEFGLNDCFLLIESLGKHDTYEDTYKNVIDLVYDLSEAGLRPHFYYGDFFSNLLAYFGLCGTTYGVMYGEEYTENLEYSESSGMLNRYFVDQIKDFLKVPAAVELMKKTGTGMCDCNICQRHFDDWDDLITRQESEKNLMNLLQKHYVEKRWEHARMVETKSFDEVVNQLHSDFREYIRAYSGARQISPSKNFEYLQRWIHTVESREELATKSP